MKKLFIILLVAVAVLAVGVWLTVRSLLAGDRVKAAIEAQASAALGRPVKIDTAAPQLFPRVGIDLSGVAIGEGREVTVDRITLTTGLRALIARRVEDAAITVSRSRIDVRWALALLAALGESDETAAAPAGGSALTVESIGALAFRDVTLVAGARTLHVDLESSLTGGDRFVISRMHGTSDHSDFRATGELSSISKRTGKFEVDADSLDLDGLMAFLAASTPASTKPIAQSSRTASALAPLNIEIAIRAKQGRALGAALSNVLANCAMRGDDAVLENLRVGVFGGAFKGSAAFRGSPPDSKRPADAAGSAPAEGRYEWRGTFDNLDVPSLMTFAGSPGSMTGRLSGTAFLGANGTDPQEAMKRTRGTARVTITDGRIPGLEIVRNVILAFGKPSGERPAGSGEAFTRLASTLNVSGPTLSTRDLAFESRDFDMTGEGTVSLASQSVDFRTNVILSRELSAQAGRDLYRLAREGERIVLPARISGTASSPTVFIDVQAALQRALRNRAEDEVKSLFDRLIKKK